MQSHTSILSAFTLSTAMSCGAGTMAADLPKEGTFSELYSAIGTAKATQIGKDRALIVLDETGLSVGQGILDHIRWHCFGIEDATNGIAQVQFYCVGTDPSGDQMVVNGANEKFAVDAKSFRGIATFTTGTGKYAGISGSIKFECHPGEFQAASDGTYVNYCPTHEGSYKLP
jgi:hypothetical protein